MQSVSLATLEKEKAELLTCRKTLIKLEQDVADSRIRFEEKLSTAAEVENSLRQELRVAIAEKSLASAQLKEKIKHLQQLQEKAKSSDQAASSSQLLQLHLSIIEKVDLFLYTADNGVKTDVERGVQEHKQQADIAGQDLIEVVGISHQQQNQLSEAEAEINALQREMDDWISKHGEQCEETQQHKLTIQRLHHELEENTQQLQLNIQSRQEFEEQHSEKVKQLEEEISAKQADILNKTEEISNLQTQLQELKSSSEDKESAMRDRLDDSGKRCQNLLSEIERLNLDLTTERSLVSTKDKEIKQCSEQVAILREQVAELESHQLEKSSLYREYKELKSLDVEVKLLKRTHKEAEESWTQSKLNLEEQLIDEKRARTMQNTYSLEQISELRKGLSKSNSSAETLKSRFQEKLTECNALLDKNQKIKDELQKSKEALEEKESVHMAQIDELEQYIRHLQGDELLFPLSKSKKRKLMDPSTENDDVSTAKDLQEMSESELRIHASKLVAALEIERFDSKQKDEYVEFMRSAHKNKNAVILSRDDEKWQLQKTVNQLSNEIVGLAKKLADVKKAKVSSESRIWMAKAEAGNYEALNKCLSQQVQSLLEENERLRSDPFSRHLSSTSAAKIPVSIESLQQQNLSLQKRLLSAETEKELIKREASTDVGEAKKAAEEEVEQERTELLLRISVLEARLKESDSREKQLQSKLKEAAESHQQSLQRMNRDQEMAELKQNLSRSELRCTETKMLQQDHQRQFLLLKDQLEQLTASYACAKSELELLKHQQRDAANG